MGKIKESDMLNSTQDIVAVNVDLISEIVKHTNINIKKKEIVKHNTFDHPILISRQYNKNYHNSFIPLARHGICPKIYTAGSSG